MIASIVSVCGMRICGIRMRAFCSIATEVFGYAAMCDTGLKRGCLAVHLVTFLASGPLVTGIYQPTRVNQGFLYMMNPMVLSNLQAEPFVRLSHARSPYLRVRPKVST
jgi:hypothetical protein